MEFSVLGPLEVRQEGRVVPISGQLRKSLLGILLLNRGRITPVASLIDGMWPDEPPRSAVENIRTYVCQIRSVFESCGEPDRVETHSCGYRFEVDEGELDLNRFLVLADGGRDSLRERDAVGAADQLAGAARLWEDNPLSGIQFGAGVSAKLVALEERRRQVDIDLIEARMLLRDHATLAPMLRHLTAQHPLDEGLWCRLIVVLYAMGRTAEALKSYADARRVLLEELGIEPGPELRRIQRAILTGEDWETVALATQRFSATVDDQMPEPVPTVLGRAALSRHARSRPSCATG